MGDSHNSRPVFPPGVAAASGKPAATAGAAPANQAQPPTGPSQPSAKAGRVIHDARGNAVWDWFKETTRTAIDSTSRLLRRLEVPELKVEEEPPESELSLESDRDAGGGYDPYGGAAPSPRKPGGVTPLGNAGGGYDPYGKGAARKPGGKR